MSDPKTPLLSAAYVASGTLSAPFLIIAAMFDYLSIAFYWVAGIISDNTSYRIWCVRHTKRCAHYSAADNKEPQ